MFFDHHYDYDYNTVHFVGDKTCYGYGFGMQCHKTTPEESNGCLLGLFLGALLGVFYVAVEDLSR